MKSNRRDFLKLTGLTGIGIAGARVFGYSPDNRKPFPYKHSQKFNMSGYAAPKLDTVRIGVIGIGSRGSGALRRLSRIDGADIKALCDLVPAKVNEAVESLRDTAHNPDTYTGGENEWKKLCEREDIDLVYICTPWHLHTPMAVYAMENDKHAATEIPAAKTIDECWQLVETSERTRKHCMMLENVCYDFFEMVTLNMARQGFFGEIIHGEGAYIHDLMRHNFDKDQYEGMWRLKENASRNGNLYAQHGLGPIAQLMNLNYGDQMNFMVSVSSNDFMMKDRAQELAAKDDFYEPFAEENFRGNMNTSIIKTQNGRTIMLQHDVSSPRPYSRIHLISGTKGIARKYPSPAKIATGHDGWLSDEEFNSLEEKYTPEITKRVGEMARQVGGHGGMDTLMDWRLIDCLRNGLPLDMNVYDAALWSSIGPLSEWSVSNNSNPIDVPDFTAGAWKANQPGMDLNLQTGGTTKII
ncbi:MAG: Gfo/Idh/MocA family oxidoreductase [Balneolales bacterium]